MAGWFAKLMQQGHARSRHASDAAGFPTHSDVGTTLGPRDARYDAIVQMLRDREAEDRAAREKRQRGYRQSLESDAGTGSGSAGSLSPTRLSRFRTKVPCRATPEARALLAELRKQFSGGTVTFPPVTSRRQAVMLTRGAGVEPKQIGWVEHSVQTDPKLCNVRDQGLAVETEGGTMLVLRFRYPPTAVRMSASCNPAEALPRGPHHIEGRIAPAPRGDGLELAGGASDEVARVDFTEIRPALDLRPSDKGSSPRLVWVTRHEVETMNAVRSRDYEAFYVRFKLEVLAGIWSSLTGLLASSPGTRWHRGSCYTVLREPDATKGKIHQRTVDDSGRAVDIGADRTYDAAHATDILLLYLDGDILADVADIFFTLHSLGSADAYFLKEELFTGIRRFWASSQSLASRYGSDLAAVVRMSQRAVPMPGQALLLKQDWTNLRQSLVDRYGEGGRKAGELVGQNVYRPRTGSPTWPFASFPAGEVNVGLRVVYRQEWQHLGARRGELLRTVPPAPKQAEEESTSVAPGPAEGARQSLRSAQDRPSGGRAANPLWVETTIEQGDAARHLDAIVDDVVNATVAAMKWPRDFEGSINTGVRGLASTTDMGLEAECRESSRDTGARLSDIMRRMASMVREEPAVRASAEPAEGVEPAPPTDGENAIEDDATYVYSRLQNQYEILTRPAEIQNVVLVAEKLPTPAEIDLAWVRRHDSILAKVLLDESLRDTLDSIRRESRSPQRDLELDAKRDHLYEHLRANILHYQRAIWQREDPQQRSMRYRKSGRKVPLEWRFELEAGPSLTIDELGDRLSAANVDGQFAAYAGGREADLDQVIDPAGPVAYYGNYAVYHMRPEFGSANLFSMLHFFKSPYLRRNAETGEVEVADPVQIQVARDAAVASASDQEIDRHRDEIFQYVPELRRELARARRKVSDGTDPGAVDRLERNTGLLRGHFATYLFRRERARRVVLDTDGQVIDVIRRVEPEPETPGLEDVALDLVAAPEGYELILEDERGLELLSVNGHRAADAEWAIVRDGGARTPCLVAGAGGGALRTHDREGEPMFIARDDGKQAPALRVGRTHDPETGQVILVGDDGRGLTSVAGAGASQAQAGVILSRGGDARTPNLCVGQAHQPDADSLIVGREHGRLRVAAAADGRAASPQERAILAEEKEDRAPGLFTGSGTPRPDERAIVAREDLFLKLTSVVTLGAAQASERVILEGGDGERTPSLVAGQAHDPEAHRVIPARDVGGLRLISGTGAKAASAHERVILARGAGRLRPSLIAG